MSINAVKVLERNKDDARAAVVYSFQPSPDEAKGARKISADPHQEILRFKLVSIPYEEPARKIWKIVPPATPPNELKSQIDLTERDDLFANVAYHLAQKQVPETIGTPVERSMDNLKLLGEGTFQLVEDYGEVYAFAPAYVTEALAIYTFTRNPAVFQVPDTNEIYAFNTNLCGLNQAAVNEVAHTVLFYEGQSETPIFRYDGQAAICFADGHVALVSPDEAKSLIWKP